MAREEWEKERDQSKQYKKRHNNRNTRNNNYGEEQYCYDDNEDDRLTYNERYTSTWGTTEEKDEDWN